MKITDVQISLLDGDKLKGFANITIDNELVIHGLKIIRGMDRYFVAMPNRKKKDGSFSDIAHPITHDFRLELEQLILDKYWELVACSTPSRVLTGVFEV